MEGKEKVIGIKQSLKLLESGNEIDAVYLALDADQELLEGIKQICYERSIQIVYIDTRKELGSMNGIQVGAAVVCILP